MLLLKWASQVVVGVKNLSANAGNVRDAGSIPGPGRSPGGGHGHPLQYSCLENPTTEEPGGLQYIRSPRVGHDTCTFEIDNVSGLQGGRGASEVLVRKILFPDLFGGYRGVFILQFEHIN